MTETVFSQLDRVDVQHEPVEPAGVESLNVEPSREVEVSETYQQFSKERAINVFQRREVALRQASAIVDQLKGLNPLSPEFMDEVDSVIGQFGQMDFDRLNLLKSNIMKLPELKTSSDDSLEVKTARTIAELNVQFDRLDVNKLREAQEADAKASHKALARSSKKSKGLFRRAVSKIPGSTRVQLFFADARPVFDNIRVQRRAINQLLDDVRWQKSELKTQMEDLRDVGVHLVANGEALSQLEGMVYEWAQSEVNPEVRQAIESSALMRTRQRLQTTQTQLEVSGQAYEGMRIARLNTDGLSGALENYRDTVIYAMSTNLYVANTLGAQAQIAGFIRSGSELASNYMVKTSELLQKSAETTLALQSQPLMDLEKVEEAHRKVMEAGRLLQEGMSGVNDELKKNNHRLAELTRDVESVMRLSEEV